MEMEILWPRAMAGITERCYGRLSSSNSNTQRGKIAVVAIEMEIIDERITVMRMEIADRCIFTWFHRIIITTIITHIRTVITIIRRRVTTIARQAVVLGSLNFHLLSVIRVHIGTLKRMGTGTLPNNSINNSKLPQRFLQHFHRLQISPILLIISIKDIHILIVDHPFPVYTISRNIIENSKLRGMHGKK